MIKNKQDYKYYLEADRIALGRRSAISLLSRLIYPDKIHIFQKRLRKMEYLTNCKPGLFWRFAKVYQYFKFKRLSEHLGFTIPLNVFGPGLSIAHIGSIVINEGCKIGANCRLHICVNIGTAAGFKNKAPIIGDNVYIAPGVKIYGEIEIANGVAISANAVVNKSFLSPNIAIGGLPAKELKKFDTKTTNIFATDIIDQGVNAKKLVDKAAIEINSYLDKRL